MLHVKILILISGIELNNNFSDLSYPVLIKNYIFCGGLWYNINMYLLGTATNAPEIWQYKEKHSSAWSHLAFLLVFMFV